MIKAGLYFYCYLTDIEPDGIVTRPKAVSMIKVHRKPFYRLFFCLGRAQFPAPVIELAFRY